MQEQFYLVWNPSRPHHSPQTKHPSEHSARQEAERLARMEPGQEIYVLQPVAHCKKKEVFWSDYDRDLIPF